MTQPAFFLFSPSRKDACRLGLDGWYEWFQSQESVQIINDTDAVSGGVFVSFSPVCEEGDTFPELEGRADRWLALDSAGNVSSSCLLAKKCGVERLLHAQLIDEMSSAVIPSALLFLMDRGIWLPDTLVQSTELSFPGENRNLRRSDRLLLFLIDEGFVEQRRLRFLIEMLGADLNPLGYRTKVASVDAFGSEDQTELPNHVVLLSDQLGTALEVSRWAEAHSIGFAIWEETETSPLRQVFAGGAYPETIGVPKLKLRPFFKELGRFLERDQNSDQPAVRSNPNWCFPRSLDTFEFTRKEGNVSSPFQPPVFATFLASTRGTRFGDWSRERIGNSVTLQYVPLYYSCEYFREHDPFDILFDQALRAKCRTGLVRLRELLEEGYKVSNGYGAMYVLHLGWCSILLEEHERIIEYIAFAREPSFSALSLYLCELGLALWYEGEMDVAQKGFETIASIGSDKKSWSVSFLLASILLGCKNCTDTDIDSAFLTEETDSWIDSMYLALSADSKDEAWNRAIKIDPAGTEAMRERLKTKRAAK